MLHSVFTRKDVEGIVDQVAAVLAETFRAALQSPVHFQVNTFNLLQVGFSLTILQPLPNAFELYGVDFLLSHSPMSERGVHHRFRVNMLEINSEPAIEMTGPRLTWILEDLFVSIRKECIDPFLHSTALGCSVNERDEKCAESLVGLRKCFTVTR